MGPDEAAETASLLNTASADCIMRGEVRSPGGDLSGYDPTYPGLTRGYTSAIVRLAEEVAYNRHPDSENIAAPEAVLEKAMRDFAHNLHWAIGGAEADLYTCSQQHGGKKA